jgi:hypothetical protein
LFGLNFCLVIFSQKGQKTLGTIVVSGSVDGTVFQDYDPSRKGKVADDDDRCSVGSTSSSQRKHKAHEHQP